MPVMMPEIKVWAEDAGVEVLVSPHSGVLEISILRDGKIQATATIARYRWDRIVQAVLPPPVDL
jgi:hypothetical protein